MITKIKNPKYHIGDEIMYNYMSSDGGGTSVCIIKRINYLDERTGYNTWIYNNGAENIFEKNIIKRLKNATHK